MRMRSKPSRVCRVCGKRLAGLNPNRDLCFAHDPRLVKYEYFPVSKFCGFSKGIAIDDPYVSVITVGDPRYNDIAFTKLCIYPDIK